MSNEQGAIAVIRLVKKATGGKTSNLALECFSVDTLSAQHHALGPSQLRMNFSD
jgi:hypothetical protein